MKAVFWMVTRVAGSLAFTILIEGCTSLGATPNLATDCSAQAAVLEQGKTLMPKLAATERALIDAQIELSKGYCTGSLPADETAASKAVEASTAQISAVLGVAALRK